MVESAVPTSIKGEKLGSAPVIVRPTAGKGV